MAELHDLLDRATDAIEPRGGAADALRTARRRRARRRGSAAVLASAVAVIAVVVGVRIATGGTGESAPPPAESPTVTATESASPTPSIDPTLVHPAWDPRGAEGLPVTDLGVPRVLPASPAGSIDAPPVALLDDGSQVLAVAADGAAVEVDLPEELGPQRTLSLSPDGTRVVVVAADRAYWRDVNSPTWRRLHVELVSGGLGQEPDVRWIDRSTIVVQGDQRGARVDLRTGAVATLLEGFSVDTPAWLSRSVSDDASIAAVWSGRPADGVVVADATTWEPRALLPMLMDGDRIMPVAWVDDDTVAFQVTPPGSPKEYLVTWNVETGELSRISCWYTSFQASFATDLLG